MSNVIPFQKEQQHAYCEAICIECKHEWIEVSPLGTNELECPNCSTFKGRYKRAFNFAEGEFIRVCHCGNDMFYLSTSGHLCAKCGTFQEY